MSSSPNPSTSADPAELRSLAVAKLKRAASLPRMKNGRRRAAERDAGIGADSEGTEDSSSNSRSPSRTEVDLTRPVPSSASPTMGAAEEEPEVGKQFKTPAEFAAYHLARTEPSISALRSLTPSPIPPSSYSHLQSFPLPSLQTLQKSHLQRSNSAAARMMAMSKLTGEPAPPALAVDDDVVEGVNSPTSPSEIPPVVVVAASGPSRPRLGRAHTVSGSGGEERRSAVGRRMMMRLGNRVASPAVSPTPQSLPSSTPTSPDDQHLGDIPSSLTVAEDSVYPADDQPHSNKIEEVHLPQQLPNFLAAGVAHPSVTRLSSSTMPSQPRSSLTSSINSIAGSHSHVNELWQPGGQQLSASYSPAVTPSEISSTDYLNDHEADGEHTDSFEFADHLQRSNSQRTNQGADGASIAEERSPIPIHTTLPTPQHSNNLHSAFEPFESSTSLTSSQQQPSTSQHIITLPRPSYSSSTGQGYDDSESSSPSGITILPPEPAFMAQRSASGSSFPDSIKEGQGPWSSANIPQKRMVSGSLSQSFDQYEDRDFHPNLYGADASNVVDLGDATPTATQGEFHPIRDNSLSESRSLPSHRTDAASSTAGSISQWEEIESPSHTEGETNVNTSNSRKVSPKASMGGISSRSSSQNPPSSVAESSSPRHHSPLPPASPMDTKYQDSKLAPFPGIVRLATERSRLRGLSVSSVNTPEESPSRRTSEQNTSASPFQNGSPSVTGEDLSTTPQQSYFDIPPRSASPSSLTPSNSRGKSWFAKKFSVSGGRPSLEDRGKRPSISNLMGLSRKASFAGSFGDSSETMSNSMLGDRLSPTISHSPPSRRPSIPQLFEQRNTPPSPSHSNFSRENSLGQIDEAPHFADPFAASPPGHMKKSSLEPVPSTSLVPPSRKSPPRVSMVLEAAEERLHPADNKLRSLTAPEATDTRSLLVADLTHSPSLSEQGAFPSPVLGSPIALEAGSPVSGQSDGSPSSDGYTPQTPSREQLDELNVKSTPVPLPWPAKTKEVLGRLDSILSLGGGVSQRPSALENPPRKLLLYSPILQVVNSSTVKDRFLFLFTDILVIAKPILNADEFPNIDKKFVVKSIVELSGLKLSGTQDDDAASENPKRQHPFVTNFIDMFAREPEAAIEYLTERSSLSNESIASLLFKTSELDRGRLGEFLSHKSNKSFLRGFINRFPFGSVRIDEALRMFLLSVRLPTEANASERLLQAFAYQWHEANHNAISFDRDLSARLVLAIMQLNDAMNPTSSFGTFAFANKAITVGDFMEAFRVRDSHRLVNADLLEAVYLSIRKEKLNQALDSADAELERDVYMSPPKLPSRLTYGVPSPEITISISEPDHRFSVRLHGEGLQFDPPVLTFAKSSHATFRITGVALGQKTVLFSRAGTNSALYAGLPFAKTFFVERAFMRKGHTFQLSFVREPSHTKRKYLFSFDEADTRTEWVHRLQQQINHSVAVTSIPMMSGPVDQQVRKTAEAVALQVLRDSLIPQEEPPPSLNTKRPNTSGSMAGSNVNQSVFGTGSSSTHQRSASVSLVYGRTGGRAEGKLDQEHELEKRKASKTMRPGTGGKAGSQGLIDTLNEEKAAATPFLAAQTGREICLICQQNSLIPMVLSFLQAGRPPPEGIKKAQHAKVGLGFF